MFLFFFFFFSFELGLTQGYFLLPVFWHRILAIILFDPMEKQDLSIADSSIPQLILLNVHLKMDFTPNKLAVISENILLLLFYHHAQIHFQKLL